MNAVLWNSLGLVGDDLISEAEPEKLTAYFKAKRHRTLLKLKISAVAACLCLIAVGLFIAIPMLHRGPERINTDNFVILSEYTDIDQDFSSECPKGPFDGLIGYRVLTEKLGYDPNEPAILVLSYGLVREPICGGIIKATVSTGDFSTDAPREITVGRLSMDKDHGWEARQLKIALIPPDERAFGEIEIEFRLYPDEPRPTYPLDENGSILLTHIDVPYIANEFETAFSPYSISGRELFLERLPILLEAGKITEKQFADMYCDILFEDTVYVEMHQRYFVNNNSFRFRYYSKNIRYESPIVNDYEMSIKRFQPKALAVAALDYMKENGIITEEEYRAELLWLDEVGTITDDNSFYQGLYAH